MKRLKLFNTINKETYGLYKLCHPNRPSIKVKLNLIKDAGGVLIEKTSKSLTVLVKRSVAESL